MYTWLIQSYEAMDAEQKATSAAAAKQLRLMVSSLELLSIVCFHGGLHAHFRRTLKIASKKFYILQQSVTVGVHRTLLFFFFFA